jgi:hypothetical protein
MSFAYTCGIAHGPHGYHRLAVDLVSVGRVLSGSVVSRDGDNLARNAPMRPTIPTPALACRNNTVAICFFLDAPTVPC